MNKETLQSLNSIINYLYTDEYKNWEESNFPKEHIFNDIKAVSEWADKQNICTQ